MDSTIFPRKGNSSYRVLSLLYTRKIRGFESSVRDPQKAQEKVLSVLMKQGRASIFGEEFEFSKVRSLEEYREKVPIQNYEDFRPFVERILEGEKDVLFSESVTGFVETSGTSAKAKLIPVTKSWSEHVQTAQILWIISLLRDRPGIEKGQTLRLLSSATERQTPLGLPIGANTGRMQDALPKWMQGATIFPKELAEIKEQELKVYLQLRFALQVPITSWTTANPSTILLYCRKLKEYQDFLAQDLAQGTAECGPASHLSSEFRAKIEPYLQKCSAPIDWRPASIWPLKAVNCWKGGPAQYFVEQLPKALGADIPIRDVGITASEGYFALPLSDEWDGGVLWMQGELLEFRDEQGEMHWAWELVQGQQYELIISTLMGLYRYDLKDIVEVTGFYHKTPIVRFVGKAGRFLNATGEKISEEQFLKAVQATKIPVQGVTARTIWQECPYIEVGIEAEELPEDFAERLEKELQNANIEYAQKRTTGRLNPLQITVFKKGTYQRYRNFRIEQGASATQVKDLLIAVRDDEWENLLGNSR
jgi:hypothetical protein